MPTYTAGHRTACGESSRSKFAVTSARVGRSRGCGGFGRNSLASPPGGPPGAHGREPLRALSAELREIVLRHYWRPLTVGVVARALASSPPQVQRAFNEVGETSFSAYLREVRLRTAADLLARQPLTVRQVALLVGYRQPAHLAKASRRRYGVTPAAYRDLARRHPRQAPSRGQRGPRSMRRTVTRLAVLVTALARERGADCRRRGRRQAAGGGDRKSGPRALASSGSGSAIRRALGRPDCGHGSGRLALAVGSGGQCSGVVTVTGTSIRPRVRRGSTCRAWTDERATRHRTNHSRRVAGIALARLPSIAIGPFVNVRRTCGEAACRSEYRRRRAVDHRGCSPGPVQRRLLASRSMAPAHRQLATRSLHPLTSGVSRVGSRSVA
jgi:AraC family transcriptional regulator of adaptative response / methylphosphotriester-DNA alkyltransferase methyltransferase